MKKGGEPFDEEILTANQQKTEKMIILTSINLKKILKKRRAIRGSIPKLAQNAMPPRSGGMAMCWRILMGLPREFGSNGTDVLSAAQLSDCVPKDFSQDFKPL